MVFSIHAKLDQINEKLENINVILAKQEVNIEQHIRRTELLEQEIVPVKAHVVKIQGALQIFGILGVLASIVGVILKLVKVL